MDTSTEVTSEEKCRALAVLMGAVVLLRDQGGGTLTIEVQAPIGKQWREEARFPEYLRGSPEYVPDVRAAVLNSRVFVPINGHHAPESLWEDMVERMSLGLEDAPCDNREMGPSGPTGRSGPAANRIGGGFYRKFQRKRRPQ